MFESVFQNQRYVIFSTVKENDIFPFFTTPSTPLRLSAPQMYIVYHTLSNFLESIFLFKLKRDHKEDENKHFNNNNMGGLCQNWFKILKNSDTFNIFWNRFQGKKDNIQSFQYKNWDILIGFTQLHQLLLELIWRKKKNIGKV